MSKSKKLYLIGIDSAPLWIISKLYSDYKMKGFEQFIKNGKLVDMKSTLPPITAAAWPTIYTGVGPDTHGVMNFFSLDKDYNKQLLFYDTEKNPPFWDILADNGLKSLVITPAMVVGTSDRDNVDLITGFPLAPKFSSKELEDNAKKFSFSGEPEIEEALKDKKIGFKEAVAKYRESTKARSELSKNLIKKNDYDLVFVCFTEIDRIQHYVLNIRNWEQYVAPLYKDISDFIEWVLEYSAQKNEDSLIMIVSDHGAQPISNKFLLNAWLINSGYAKLKDMSGEESIDSDTFKSDVSVARGMKKTSRRGTITRPKTAEERAEIIQTTPNKMVTRFICASVVENIYEDEPKRSTFDMENTRAFASLTNDPVSNIWINDKRFSNPTVKDGEKRKLKEEIIHKLRSLKSEDGAAVVADAIDGNEYYKSDKLFIIPDIIIEMKGGYTIDVFNYLKEGIFMAPEGARSGDHTKYGIFGSYSKNYNVDAKDMNVLDVAPIIFDYFKVNKSDLSKSRLEKR